MKLASELSKVATGRTLYILDEPTTGLHFADVERLLEMLDRLVEQGNTVVVIEHNLDVIKTADRIIDLGPEGGEEGGRSWRRARRSRWPRRRRSYTGRFLAEIVEPAARRKRRGAGARRWPRRRSYASAKRSRVPRPHARAARFRRPVRVAFDR